MLGTKDWTTTDRILTRSVQDVQENTINKEIISPRCSTNKITRMSYQHTYNSMYPQWNHLMLPSHRSSWDFDKDIYAEYMVLLMIRNVTHFCEVGEVGDPSGLDATTCEMHYSVHRFVFLVCAFVHYPLAAGRHDVQIPFLSLLTKVKTNTADRVYEPKIQPEFAILPRASQGKSISQTPKKAGTSATESERTQSLVQNPGQVTSTGGFAKAISSQGHERVAGTHLGGLSQKKPADITSEVSSKPPKPRLNDKQKAEYNAKQRLKYQNRTAEEKAAYSARRRERRRPRTGEQRARHIAYQKEYHKRRKKLKKTSGTSIPTPAQLWQSKLAQAHQSLSKDLPEISESTAISEDRRRVRSKPSQDQPDSDSEGKGQKLR